MGTAILQVYLALWVLAVLSGFLDDIHQETNTTVRRTKLPKSLQSPGKNNYST
ncbi:hypothetical protein BDN72DRAFT_840131 [Pluteus cervinus]|uniref:Uncharacterized protein n=1 Tax=Pluteus cervinus TaxID=181527 RepID=A0ACD3AWC5_9AGAR|nr:hypothetical protein BDN72DRAFT_840131 [Pluteus cervinus]